MFRTNIFISILFLLASIVNAQGILFEEDFQDGIPNSFTLIDVDLGFPHSNIPMFVDAWVPVIESSDTSNVVAASTSWYDPAGQADDWLITPAITLGTSSLLKWQAKALDSTFRDGYEVYISTSGTNIPDFTDLIFNINKESSDWTNRQVDLSSYSGQTIHIAWRNNSIDQFVLMVDNIEVIGQPLLINTISPEELSVNISPNPANTYTDIIIELNRDLIVEVNLYNVVGEHIKTVKTEQLQKGFNKIPLQITNLSNGIYFIKVKSDLGEIVKKLIVTSTSF